MEKRYQVFVSSTFRDLREERQEVIQALLELDCIPSGMELFPASNDDQWTLIQRVIDDCDYYLVIIGGRYGSVDAQGLGYTEKEYDYAVERGKPIMAFLHGEPDAIPAGKSEMSTDARVKLDAFRAKAERRMCRYWTSAKDLGAVVSRSYVQIIKTHPAEGWVRARHAGGAEQMRRIQELQDEVRTLRQRLESASTEAPPGTDHLAQGIDKLSISYRHKLVNIDYVTDGRLDLTWDEFFKIIGPVMMEPCTETTLSDVVKEAIRERDYRGHDMRNLQLSNEDMRRTRMQLMALGLIRKAEPPSYAADGQMFWGLTPYGEHYLTRKLADLRPQATGRSRRK